MSSPSTATSSEEPFTIPVSSSGDILMLFPKSNTTALESEMLDDLLTEQELPHHDDTFFGATGVDFLVKCSETSHNINLIDLGEENLDVKCDPLHAKARLNNNDSSIQTQSIIDLTDNDVGYESASAASVFIDNNQYASPMHSSSMSAMHMPSGDKPMQVVSPVISNVPMSCASQIIRTPALVRSESAFPLSPIEVATDTLINLSRKSSIIDMDNLHYVVGCLQPYHTTLQNHEQEVLQLRLQNKELKEKLQDMEHKNSIDVDKIEKLEMQLNSLLENNQTLLQKINEKSLKIKQMCIVLEEFEKTLSCLIDENQRFKTESQISNEKLIHERDQALNHLASLEDSFNDLLAKYEKCKTIILEDVKREKTYVQKLDEYEAGIKKYEELYNSLKKMTSEKLSDANVTLDNMQKQRDSAILKFTATIKKHEVTISSLQASIDEKTRHNDELIKICDDLLN